MTRVQCPVCGQSMAGTNLALWPRFPFCSERCKTIDLGRWLGERYRIPAEEPEEPAYEEKDIP